MTLAPLGEGGAVGLVGGFQVATEGGQGAMGCVESCRSWRSAFYQGLCLLLDEAQDQLDVDPKN